MSNEQNDTAIVAIASNDSASANTVTKEVNLMKKEAFLPPEIIAEVALYCSARDQVSLKLLCKGVKAVLPKVPLLNIKYFKESFYHWRDQNQYLVMPKPFHFKLNPLVVEEEPFSVLDFIFTIINNSCELKPFSVSLGASLERIFTKVLQHPNHPKFSLLTLPIASFANSVPAMQFLLQPAFRNRIEKEDYEKAIYFACLFDYPEALKIMLELNSPLANPSYEDNTPILIAAQQGNSRCVELLLGDNRVNPTACNNISIQLAAYNGHLEAFRLLHQDARVDPSAYDDVCIRWVAEKGHLEIFTILLQDERVNPAADHNACIRLASENGHTPIARLLLADPRVDASARDNYALLIAASRGHTSIVGLLLADPRVDASANGNESLRVARKKGHLEVVALLEAHMAIR